MTDRGLVPGLYFKARISAHPGHLEPSGQALRFSMVLSSSRLRWVAARMPALITSPGSVSLGDCDRRWLHFAVGQRAQVERSATIQAENSSPQAAVVRLGLVSLRQVRTPLIGRAKDRGSRHKCKASPNTPKATRRHDCPRHTQNRSLRYTLPPKAT